MRLALNRRSRASLAVAAVAATTLVVASQVGTSSASVTADRSKVTSTPIKHLVVLFDENVSFDHYFATYPHATNKDGTRFTAPASTPKVNTLRTAGLLRHNPNLYDPVRLGPDQALTCDQNHNYGPEQKAENGGASDQFVQNVSVDTCSGGLFGAPGLTMDYYDGNTVTGIWNYAKSYAMSDNSFGTTFGPSTPGALNLVSGQTHGVHAVDPTTGATVSDAYAVVSPDAQGVGTVINDPDPAFDDCSNKNRTASNNLAVMTGRNIGDLLNARGVTWGWFQGGFRPTTPYAGSGHSRRLRRGAHQHRRGLVARLQPSPLAVRVLPSTSNPHHLPPTSVSAIGHTDQANHNYDLTDFDAALAAGNLPAVSFLKAPEYQDGHAGLLRPAGRAGLPGQGDQRDPASRSSGRRRRSSSRTTTPTGGTTTSPRRAQRVERPGQRRGHLHLGRRRQRHRRWVPGPLRPRTAPADAGAVAVVEGQLRRPQADRAGLDH